MKDELLTIKEAAEFFGVSTRTLIRWEEKGVLKSMRTVGNQRRYSKQHIANLFKVPSQNPAPQVIPEPQITTTNDTFSHPALPENKSSKQNHGMHRALVSGALAGLAFLLLLVIGITTVPQLGSGFAQLTAWLQSPEQQSDSKLASSQVLGASDRTPNFSLQVNVPAIFHKKVTLLDAFEIKNQLTVGSTANLDGGIKTNNKDIDAGKGKITASNIIYSLLAGTNVTLSGDPQRPTISATGGVTSIQGATGALNLTTGSGISLNGLEITNTGVTSFQGQTGTVSLSGGTGIGISGTEITNTDPGSGQNIFKVIDANGTAIQAATNNDQLTFAAGSGITITGDAGSKTITITGTPTGFSGLTTDGVLYASSPTTVTSTDAGTNGYILKSNGPGVAPTWVAPGTTLGFVPFDQITSGTNTTAAMIVGSGASLGFTGTGTINSSTLLGSTWVAPGAIGSVTPNTGAFTSLTATTINGLSVTNNGSNTLTIATGKTFIVNNSLTVAGTDGTTFTFPSTSGTVVTTDATQTLTNKTIAAGSNTITGLTNSNLSGSAGITNANLANSSITVTTAAGSGLSGGGSVALGASVSLTNAGVKSATASTGITIDQSTGDITITNNGVTTAVAGTGIGVNAGTGSVTFSNTGVTSAVAGTGIGISGGTGAVTITNNGVTSLAGTLHQISVSGGTGAVTLSLPQNIDSAASPNFTGLTLSGFTTNGGILYTNGTGTIAQTAAGGSGDCLKSSGGGSPTWGSCAAASYFQRNSTTLSPATTGDSLYLGDSGTTSVYRFEVNGKQTGKALAVLNETGDQDIFTASKSGTTKFTINNAGNVIAVGSITASNFTGSSTGTNTGDITVTGQNYLSLTGQQITANAINLSGSNVTNTLGVGNGGTGVNGSTAANGQILIGNGSGYTLATLTQGSGIGIANGSGSITISNSGVTSLTGTASQISVSGATGAVTLSLPQNIATNSDVAFNSLTLGGLTTNGGILYTNGSGLLSQTSAGSLGNCLTSGGGGAPTWSTCAAGSNLWQSNNGTISPFSNTLDLLVGGTSTASAKFAFTGANSGTPTASISGSTAGSGVYLTGDGTLSTTKNSSLLLNPNGGNVGIGLASPTTALEVKGWISTTGASSGLTINAQDNSANYANIYSSTGELAFYTGLNIREILTQGGRLGLGLNNWNPQATLDVLGTSDGGGTVPVASFSGATAKAAVVVDQSGVGDIFTASKSGATKFTINNAGNVVAVGSITASNFTGSSTGTNTGDITVTGQNYLSLTGQQITANAINLNSGNVTNVLGVANGGTGQNSLTSNAVLVGNGTSGVNMVTGTAGQVLLSNAGVPTFTSLGGDITSVSNTGVVTIANNAITGAKMANNTLDFTQFKDSMTLDANTAISLGGFNFTVGDNTGNGNVVVAPNAGGQAALIVNKQGNGGDIFTASASGVTKFTVDRSGNVLASGTLTGSNFSGSSTGTNTGDITITGQNYLSLSGQQITANAINLAGTNVTGILGITNGGTGSNTQNFVDLTTGQTVGGAKVWSNLGTFNGGIAVAANQNLTLAAGTGGVGIGTNTLRAALDVRGNSGTTPVASFSGATANATVIADNSGNGDLFAASSSGLNRFVIKNNGNVGIGTSNPGTLLTLQAPQGNYLLTMTDGSATSGMFIDHSLTAAVQWGTVTNNAMGFFTNDATTQMALNVNGGTTIGSYANGGTYATGPANGLAVSGDVGIGTASTLAKLDVRGSSGTTPVASIAGTTAKAAFVVDNSGTGDLFTASTSGTTRFVIDKNGYVALGGAATNTNAYINATNFTVQNDGQIYALALNNNSTAANASVSVTSTGTTVTRNVADANVALKVTQQNSSSTGDILQLANNASTVFKVSQGGTLQLGTYTQNGGVLYTNSSGTVSQSVTGSDGQFLSLVGGVPTWTTATTLGFWQRNNGTIAPINITDDILVGGTATSSAKFRISGTSGNASSAGNLTFSTAASIQTTNAQTLTIGGTTTGDVAFNPGNVGAGNSLYLASSGNVGIGTSAPSTKLQVSGSVTVSGDILANAAPTSGSTSQTTTSTDTTGNVGQYTSMKIGSDGLPVIAYYDVTNTALKVMHCTTASCSSSSTTTVDGNTGCPTGCSTSASVGQYTGITIGTDGFPVVSYYDSGNLDLKVVKCGNTSCSASNTYTTVDSTGDVGQYTSDVIGRDGLPVVSYYDNTNHDLKVAKCTTSSCSTSTITVLDSSGTDEGKYTSIAITSNGNPIIGYYEGGTCNSTSTCNPKLAICLNINCTSSALTRVDNTIATTNDSGQYLSMTIASSGSPVLAYYDNTNHQLRSTTCESFTCDVWSSNTAETSTTVGEYTSIVMGKDNTPLISYYDVTNGHLKTVKCETTSPLSAGSSSVSMCDSGGVQTNMTTTVDSNTSVGLYTSATLGIDGLPIISYYDSTNSDLKVLKCADPACETTTGGNYSGGSNIGSVNQFFNNVYAANYWGKSFQITAFDVAEQYKVDDRSIEAGDVVRISKTQTGADSEGRGITIEKSDKAYDRSVIGIVSTKPAISLGDWQDQDPASLRPVALAGRIPVKIASDSAAITPGDYLTASDQPGRAMKATDPGGATIGKALQSWTPDSGEDKILMFANLSSGTPATITDKESDLGLSDSIASLSASQSTTNEQFDTKRFDDTLATSSAYLGLAGKVGDLDTRVASLEANINLLASGSALLGNGAVGGTTYANAQSLGLDKLDVKDATVSNSLTVLGRTTLSDVGITGKVNVGLLNINGLDGDASGDSGNYASINTITGPLKLQSDGLNGIDVLNGKFLIDVKGNLYAKGGITVTKVNIETKEVMSASLGEATMEAGKTKVTIDTTAVTKDSKIFITPKTATSLPLSVTGQKDGDSFTVEMTAPVGKDIKFNWWIVN